MPLNVNTHANSVVESSFALMKFMEVLMNVVCRIVSTAVVNEYTFCVNEQQKVYVRMVLRTRRYFEVFCDLFLNSLTATSNLFASLFVLLTNLFEIFIF